MNTLKEKEQKLEEFKTEFNKIKKEKLAIIEENNKIKQDMEKQKNAMEIFKSEFNIKKEILEKTMKQMNAIKQRNGLGNEGGNTNNNLDILINN